MPAVGEQRMEHTGPPLSGVSRGQTSSAGTPAIHADNDMYVVYVDALAVYRTFLHLCDAPKQDISSS
jgi:hypothetical protein